MKIGLFFGSFNPIHVGHLIIAQTMVEDTDLDRVWFVVSPQNPFKKSASLLAEYDRLHLVRLAIEGNDDLIASDVEFALPRPSYTIDTLAHLRDKHPTQRFALIMGTDNLRTIDKWKNADVLKRDHAIYVYRRGSHEQAPSPPSGARVTMVDAPLLHISATLIRERIRSGKSVRYMVPDTVERYIEEMNLYRLGKTM